MKSFEDIVSEIYRGLKDKDLQEGLARTIKNMVPGPYRVISNWKYVEQLAEDVRKVRQETLKNIDYYIDETLKNVERYAKGKGYFVKNRDELYKIIDGIISQHGEGKKIIIKSKSIVTEEMELRQYLQRKGHEVYETDLGELLVQIAGDKPMHQIAPAIHYPKEKTIDILRKVGIELDRDTPHEIIVKAVRKFLREKYIKADIGISGANAVAADSGAVLLVENEGNIRLTTSLPPVHIAITGVEKIVPTLVDAYKQVLVQSAYSGLYPPTYLSVIAGPSSTADIEFHRVYGVHGPLEFHLVLYDGGRLKAIKTDELISEQLLCIRCGRCQGECPVWDLAANLWGGIAYGGPLGLGWNAITVDENFASNLAFLCLSCGKCKEVCPMKINIPEIARELRKRYNKKS